MIRRISKCVSYQIDNKDNKPNLCLSVGSGPAHEGDAVDDDRQVLRVDRLCGALVGRKLQHVHPKAAHGGHQHGVLLARSRHVHWGSAGLGW